MMRTPENLADKAADKERFKASRGFAKRVKEILGDAPDIVFEHVGQATFPTSVFVVKPFGKVVICGATSGFQLDFDVRYLWMRQKQIIGSHFANAYECMRANQLMAEGKVRPVLWQTMGFEGVAEAHQLLHENKHLGKISILVGAESEDEGKNEDGARRDPGRGGSVDDGRGHARSTGTSPRSGPTAGSTSGSPAAARMPAFGAKSWSLTRSIDDPLAFQQTSVWENRSDFERYWFSEEIEAARAAAHRPLRPADPARLAHARRRRVAALRPRSSGASVSPPRSSCSQ